jgi:hypothetical protein
MFPAPFTLRLIMLELSRKALQFKPTIVFLLFIFMP